jgi:small subunit ribosomal protein S6
MLDGMFVSLTMRKYELIVVFEPNLNDSQLKDETKKVQSLLEANQAEGVQVNSWGKKEIAYLVSKNRYGNFIAFNFNGENPKLISTVSSQLRISDNVLKFQAHRINERVRKFKGNPRRKPSGEEGSEMAEAEY